MLQAGSLEAKELVKYVIQVCWKLVSWSICSCSHARNSSTYSMCKTSCLEYGTVGQVRNILSEIFLSCYAAQQPNSGLSSLVIAVPASHTIRHTHPVGFLWISDQFVAETATYSTHNKQKKQKNFAFGGIFFFFFIGQGNALHMLIYTDKVIICKVFIPTIGPQSSWCQRLPIYVLSPLRSCRFFPGRYRWLSLLLGNGLGPVRCSFIHLVVLAFGSCFCSSVSFQSGSISRTRR